MTGDNGSYVLDSGGRYHPPPESIIHYGPGYRPLCDDEDDEALYTDDPVPGRRLRRMPRSRCREPGRPARAPEPPPPLRPRWMVTRDE